MSLYSFFAGMNWLAGTHQQETPPSGILNVTGHQETAILVPLAMSY